MEPTEAKTVDVEVNESGDGVPRPHITETSSFHGCTPEIFTANYRYKEPVVLRGYAAEWPAVKLWSQREHLERVLGGADAPCPCDVNTSSNFRPEDMGRNMAKLTVGQALDETMFSTPPTDVQAPTKRVYCKRPLNVLMNADLVHIESFGPAPRNARLGTETKFWMGMSGNVTPLHYDNCHSAIVQVAGRKRVLTIPLADGALIYPKSVNTGLDTSWVDLVLWLSDASPASDEERRRFPDVVDARISECVLHPGDVMYIPPCCWHLVQALDNNISVLQPFDMTRKEQSDMPRPWLHPDWGFDTRPGLPTQ